MKKYMFFLVVFLLFVGSIPIVDPEDPPVGGSPFLYFYPPENSFGMKYYKTVNWSYFDDCFVYETNIDELEVEWNKSDDSVSKFKYKFKTDVYGLYFLNISFADSQNDLILYREEDFTFDIYYQEGIISFNFTDIVFSTDFEYEYQVYSNGFKLVLFNELFPGEWEIDPSFGETGSGTGELSTYYDLSDIYYYYGINATMGVNDGTADNITVYFHTVSVNSNHTAYIHEWLDYSSSYAGDVIGVTETKIVSTGDAGSWVVFNFSGIVCLDSSTPYYLGVVCNDDVGNPPDDISVGRITDVGSNKCIRKSNSATPVSMDDPLTGEVAWPNYYPSIYCTYTEETCSGGCVDECLINETSESPLNGTTGLSPCSYINSTVWVDGSCGLINWTNISVVGVGYNNFTSPSNGTFYYNNTSPSCSTTYTWWCNTSCNGSVNSSYYIYSTWNCCDTTIENVSNSTLLNYDYNLTYVNLTSLCINSSCNTTLEWLNISVVNQNYSNNSAVAEGCSLGSNANVTGLNLSCNTDYRVFINVSSDNCSGSHFNSSYIWLNTTNCTVNVSGNISCCDCFNNSCFMAQLNASIKDYLDANGYITEDSDMNVVFSLGNEAVVFLVWLILLYFVVKGKNIYLIGFSSGIQMLIALYIFNNTSLFSQADVVILFIALFIMAFGVSRISNERKAKKKRRGGY